jgi:hypothetical protein
MCPSLLGMREDASAVDGRRLGAPNAGTRPSLLDVGEGAGVVGRRLANVRNARP